MLVMEYILLLCLPDVSCRIHIAVVCARCMLWNKYCCCVCQMLVVEYILLLCVPYIYISRGIHIVAVVCAKFVCQGGGRGSIQRSGQSARD
jgi:hypothetical protein